jgi:hypothetical protein
VKDGRSEGRTTTLTHFNFEAEALIGCGLFDQCFVSKKEMKEGVQE